MRNILIVIFCMIICNPLFSQSWPVQDTDGNNIIDIRQNFGVYQDVNFSDGDIAKFHKGLDIVAPSGTSVNSVTSGTYVSLQTYNLPTDPLFGTIDMIIEHPTALEVVNVRYTHLDPTFSSPFMVGDPVSMGDNIGIIGNYLNNPFQHLHFEVKRLNGVYVNPLNYVDLVAILDPYSNMPTFGPLFIKNKTSGDYISSSSSIFGNVEVIKEIYDQMESTLANGTMIPDPTSFSGGMRFDGFVSAPREIRFKITQSNNVLWDSGTFGFDILGGADPDFVNYLVDLNKTTQTKRNFCYRVSNMKVTPDVFTSDLGDYGWNTCHRIDVVDFDVNGVLARDIQEAKFPDGNYNLEFEARDVDFNTSNNSEVVLVDNFLPYIKQIELTVMYNNGSPKIQVIEWNGSNVNNPNIVKTFSNNLFLDSNNPATSATLAIRFTEDMNQVNASIIPNRYNVAEEAEIVLNVTSTDPKNWNCNFDSQALNYIDDYINNMSEIKINGVDLGGNKLWNQNVENGGLAVDIAKNSVPKKDPTTGNFPLDTNIEVPYYFLSNDGLHVPSCYDRIQNQGERGIDFLGPCPKKLGFYELEEALPPYLDIVDLPEGKGKRDGRQDGYEYEFLENFNCFPNPFGDKLSLSGYNPKEQNVIIDLWNIQGQKLRTLLNDIQPKGRMEHTFNLSDQPSGSYVIQMIYEDGTSILYHVVKE